MKVSIIGTVGLPANYGGFETLVEQLVFENERRGMPLDITVFCSKNGYDKVFEQKVFHGAKLRYLNLKANGVQSVLYDGLSMIKSCRSHDVLLVLGVSGALFLPFVRLFSKAKIVTNVDGIESRREKWRRGIKNFLKFSEWLCIKFSHAIVSDNKSIRDYLSESYGIHSTIIAYGGDHARQAQIKNSITPPFFPEKFALSLCRIEPENNVELILKAFSKSKKNIVFIGNWSNSKYGITLREKYQNYQNIELLDPIYDIGILKRFRESCTVYVHGHSAGGTNPSLVEMLFFDANILCFDCNFNRNTTFEKSKYFKSDLELSALLDQPDIWDLASTYDLYRAIREEYSWSCIYDKYVRILK